MIIVQVTNFKVTGMYNLPTIPSEFLGHMGTIYHNLENNPSGVDIDWRYEGGDFLPPLDTSSSFGRIITRLAYRNRFDAAEKRALKKASLGLNLNLTEDQWLTVAVAQDDIMSASYVHLDRPETISGTQALEALGLIAVGRSVEVLSPPVWSLELLAESRVIFGLPAVPTDIEMVANGGEGYSTVGQFMADHPNYGN